MKKCIALSLFVTIILLLFSSCNISLFEGEEDNLPLVVKKTCYKETDSDGHSIRIAWKFPDKLERERVFGYYGSVERPWAIRYRYWHYTSKGYTDFLIDNYDELVFARQGLVFPNYHRGDKVESVIMVQSSYEPAGGENDWKNNIIKIEKEEDITRLLSAFKEADDSDNWFKKSVERTQTDFIDDCRIYLKYKGFAPLFQYGFIDNDINGKIGVVTNFITGEAEETYFLSGEEFNVYPLDNQIIGLIKTYGVNLSITD